MLLIGFDKTSTDAQKHNARMVHFFLYDYRFERVWEKPDTVLEKLRPYRAVLSPDFSMYLEMAPGFAAVQRVPQPLVRRILGITGIARCPNRQLGQ